MCKKQISFFPENASSFQSFKSIFICFPFLSRWHFFLFPCPFCFSFLPISHIHSSHCGISMHSPAVPGCVSWLRPRSPSPEREYELLTWGLNVVETTCWQLKWITCPMSFFSSPLVNSSIRMHTIYKKNLEDIWGCKLSCRHHTNSTHSIQFAFLSFFSLCPQDCEWSHSVLNVGGRISLRNWKERKCRFWKAVRNS